MAQKKPDELRDIWEGRLARRMGGVTSSAIRELFAPAMQPGMISFAGGMPAPDLLPVEAIREACQRVLDKRGRQAIQYGSTEGYSPLRKWIAQYTSQQGMNLGCENVLILTGAQQGLDLTARLLVNPGDRVVVESPTFLGALQAFNANQATFESLPVDDEGMRVDVLEGILEKKPRFIYTVPTFQNPAGVTLSRDRRRQLIEIAAKANVPILEDDPYHELRYEGEHLPSLLAMDATEVRTEKKQGFHGNVIHLGTFSKLLGPGLRVGWAVAPEYLIRRMVQAKQGVDLHTSLLVQMVIHEVLREGFFQEHVARLCAEYRERRDVMLRAMARYFPSELTWTRPQGGIFIWVTLPNQMDATALLKEALAKKVAFVPGTPFHADEVGSRSLRLNFSYPDIDQLEKGIQRLGEVFARAT